MGVRVEKFEDLIAWQRAMALAVAVERLSRQIPLRSDFVFQNQIRRAAQSVHANIAEGFERGSRAEFHRFLGIAKASCAEVRSHLYFAREVELIDAEALEPVFDQATRLSQIIGKLRSVVAQQRGLSRMPHPSYRIPRST